MFTGHWSFYYDGQLIFQHVTLCYWNVPSYIEAACRTSGSVIFSTAEYKSLLCFPGVIYKCVLCEFVAPHTCMCICGRMHGWFYSQLNVIVPIAYICSAKWMIMNLLLLLLFVISCFTALPDLDSVSRGSGYIGAWI
jgi:hypothetical protein